MKGPVRNDDVSLAENGIPGRPQLSIEEAEQLVLAEYGIEGSASPLPSDVDQNFKIETADGRRFVLKIANTRADRSHLEFQQLAMSAASEAGLSVQNVVASVKEETLIPLDGKEDGSLLVRLVSYLDGYPIADARPQSGEVLFELGVFLGKLDSALSKIDGSHHDRAFAWDLRYSAQTMRTHMDLIEEGREKDIVRGLLELYEQKALPKLPSLPHQVIHNDANDYNIVVEIHPGGHRISGLLDFGDLSHSVRIAEVAIACAYTMLDKTDPIQAACAVTAGYHSVNPISEAELEVLYPLICSRYGISVCMAAYQMPLEPDNEYLSISQQSVWDVLYKLTNYSPDLAYFRLREGCGYSAFPGQHQLEEWLLESRDSFHDIIASADPVVFDFGVASTDWSPQDLMQPGLAADLVSQKMMEGGYDLGVGRYNEARLVYSTNQFQESDGAQRTIHLGIDLFQAPGTAVNVPIDGTVYGVSDNDLPGDYGPTVILKHEPASGPVFYTLYGHLSRESIRKLDIGAGMSAGEKLAELGAIEENGGWAPHLHFQIIGDLLGFKDTFPGVASPDLRTTWLSLCPNPNLVCRIPDSVFPSPASSSEELLSIRSAHIGPSLSLSYSTPLHIVRGYMQYLYDSEGRRYLDCVNNVPHVGHSNPTVVEAASRQFRTLTTNTRYLHDNLVEYAERLAATMPEELQVVYFVNSGSEANDLALRMARAYTGAKHTVVIDGAYHGNLSSLIDISPYKFAGPGGHGAPSSTHVAPMPDTYRGAYSGPEAGELFAGHVEEILDGISQLGESAIFIGESALSCGGQIFLPEGYLQRTYDLIRNQGGICIADEVQVGMGRMGSHFWGFKAESVVPDMVTIGKPVGNGHPLGAVVTTRDIADAFANGMEYFNTFGGNPVSCAVGLAVLDEIRDRDLQAGALKTGSRFLDLLKDLAARHPIIGDVRGRGLFIGIELVRNRETLEPAAEEASYIVNRMKEKGILLSTDGPLHNVIKIKPPLVFSADNAERVSTELDAVLSEDPVSIRLS